jgi:hypothetical protein
MELAEPEHLQWYGVGYLKYFSNNSINSIAFVKSFLNHIRHKYHQHVQGNHLQKIPTPSLRLMQIVLTPGPSILGWIPNILPLPSRMLE